MRRIAMNRGARVAFTDLALPRRASDPRARTLLVAAVLLLAAAGCQRQLMATPNLYARATDNPFVNVPPAYQTNLVEVVYATDRVRVDHNPDEPRYGCGRSKSLAAGSCTVALGRDVSWAALVAASRTAHRRGSFPLNVGTCCETVHFPEVPAAVLGADGRPVDPPDFAATQTAAEQALQSLLCARLALTPRKEAYVYIHGVGCDFDDSACVIAELWHFLGRQGVPVLYTWPAGHSGLLGYAYDRESGEFTVFHLKQFLRTLAACPDLQRVHILAHSRGADVLTTALRELNIAYRAAGKDTREALKLGNIVLAAADLDIEVASQRLAAEKLQAVYERLTIYLSEDDKAISIADWLFSSIRRLGQLRPSDLTPAQIEGLAVFDRLQLIDARVTTDLLGHSYFYESPAVSSDLILLLRDDRAAGTDCGRPLIRRRDNFWEIRDDYPRYAGN